MDLDSVAQELYGVPLPDFVTTRNDRAKQARAHGDRELATEIQALAKPTTAAWLVNQLSREHADDLTPLLDLGRELRDASSKLDGQTLRRLGRERNELVTQLVKDTRRLGADHGSRVSDDVAEEVRRTLEASFSDAEIADEVSTGQLIRAVEYAGFGDMAGFGGPTGLVSERKTAQRKSASGKAASAKSDSDRADRPAKRTAKRAKKAAKRSEPPPSRPADLGARRRQKAEAEVAEAKQRLDAAQAARDEAQQETERTAVEVERTEGEVERLRAELSTAEREAKSARHADRSAQQRLTRTERELAGVERIHDRATDRLADLDD